MQMVQCPLCNNDAHTLAPPQRPWDGRRLDIDPTRKCRIDVRSRSISRSLLSEKIYIFRNIVSDQDVSLCTFQRKSVWCWINKVNRHMSGAGINIQRLFLGLCFHPNYFITPRHPNNEWDCGTKLAISWIRILLYCFDSVVSFAEIATSDIGVQCLRSFQRAIYVSILKI